MYNIKMTGEAATFDTKAATNYSEQQQKKNDCWREGAGYSPEQC